MRVLNCILILGCLLLTACQTYTKPTHDFAKSAGNEWVAYKQDADARILVDNILEDYDITLEEAQIFYQAVVPEYNVFVNEDIKLTPFDKRIRQRYVDDYTTLLYGE